MSPKYSLYFGSSVELHIWYHADTEDMLNGYHLANQASKPGLLDFAMLKTLHELAGEPANSFAVQARCINNVVKECVSPTETALRELANHVRPQPDRGFEVLGVKVGLGTAARRAGSPTGTAGNTSSRTRIIVYDIPQQL
ncbi:hypothetical protein AC578_4138 [Pseudocercospora eumusae]|uniref:Uncharacterized protein n=1 Tax=Pseudocercospora eumusae TaxID=321146 RepID=A0A139HF47_9PEZI|nr:hypothetical protein AC578_4138 [Pseudocercospora eumusae]